MAGRVWLLWTGGWDSTFRLLQLLYDTDVQIQPLYLVDEERNSTPREIDVMRRIRGMIEDEMSEEAERLLPTDYGSYRATRMEPHHQEKWEALKERGRVGLQYPILASYAEHNDIDRMELSIEATTGSASILESVVKQRDTPAGPLHELPPSMDGEETLFRHFTFPLLDYTKRDMKEEAVRRGWMRIMKCTWFCYNPTVGMPCGVCQPCKIARAEGLGDRVGYLGPLLFFTKQPTRVTKELAKRILPDSVVESVKHS